MKNLFLFGLLLSLLSCGDRKDPDPQLTTLIGTEWELDDYYDSNSPKWTKADKMDFYTEWEIESDKVNIAEYNKAQPSSFSIPIIFSGDTIIFNPTDPNSISKAVVVKKMASRLEIQSVPDANTDDVGFRFNKKN